MLVLIRAKVDTRDAQGITLFVKRPDTFKCFLMGRVSCSPEDVAQVVAQGQEVHVARHSVVVPAAGPF